MTAPTPNPTSIEELDNLNHISDGRILATKQEILTIIEKAVLGARIAQIEDIRDEWGKWLAFEDDVDEAKISDIVNHCNLLIAELTGAGVPPKTGQPNES